MKRRSTQHRQAILQAFKDSHLLSAKELQQQIADADQSTIYRNLKKMTEDNVLQRVQTDSVTKYELAEKHESHDHFICSNCEDIKVIHLNQSAIASQLPTEKSFSVTVRGVCASCS